ncbi:MAG: AAA family ATPase [Thermoprotei archaeon]|nr:AAA family ATPase [Thermoprotei archaeon]
MSLRIKRISTGIPELDLLIEGGFPEGSWIMISGMPGTGKTIFAIHFIYNSLAVDNAKVIVVTTEQEFGDYLLQAKRLNMDISPWLRGEKKLYIIDLFHLAKRAREMSKEVRVDPLDIPVLVDSVRRAYKELGVDKGEDIRLVIDSISAFYARAPVKARSMTYELKLRLHRRNVTTLLTSQFAVTTRGTFGYGAEHIVDGVIELELVEEGNELRRYMWIKKLRMTKIPLKRIPFDITDEGIRLEELPS